MSVRKGIAIWLVLFLESSGQVPIGNTTELPCFIVSGMNLDNNGAFRNFPLVKSPANSPRTNCKVFGSYEDLDVHLKELKRTEKLKPGDSIIVIQAAHGAGKMIKCDKGDISQADIYGKYLKKFSQDLKVGVIDSSCMSDVIARKLIDDRSSPSPSTDNLCILSLSHFGFSGFKGSNVIFQYLDQLPSGTSFEKVLEGWPGAMISSSAWEDTHLAEYLIGSYGKFTRSKAAVALEVFQQIEDLVGKTEGSTCKPVHLTTQVCASPEVGKDFLNALSRMYPATERVYNPSLLRSWIASIEETSKDEKRVLESPYGQDVTRELLRTVLDFYRQEIDLITSVSSEKASSFRKFDDGFGYRMWKTLWGFMRKNPKVYLGRGKTYPTILSLVLSGMNSKLDAFCLAEYFEGLEYFRMENQETGFARLIGELEDARLSRNDPNCAKGKDELLDEVLGRSLIVDDVPVGGSTADFDEVAYWKEPKSKVRLNLIEILDAFNQASTKVPEFKDPLDQRRRKACRELKL